MKILTITDTHGVFNAIYEQNKDKIKDFDFIVLLGDHTPNDVKYPDLRKLRSRGF